MDDYYLNKSEAQKEAYSKYKFATKYIHELVDEQIEHLIDAGIVYTIFVDSSYVQLFKDPPDENPRWEYDLTIEDLRTKRDFKMRLSVQNVNLEWQQYDSLESAPGAFAEVFLPDQYRKWVPFFTGGRCAVNFWQAYALASRTPIKYTVMEKLVQVLPVSWSARLGLMQ